MSVPPAKAGSQDTDTQRAGSAGVCPCAGRARNLASAEEPRRALLWAATALTPMWGKRSTSQRGQSFGGRKPARDACG